MTKRETRQTLIQDSVKEDSPSMHSSTTSNRKDGEERERTLFLDVAVEAASTAPPET
jgi:hypothetical protein